MCAFEWVERQMCAFEWRVWHPVQTRHLETNLFPGWISSGFLSWIGARRAARRRPRGARPLSAHFSVPCTDMTAAFDSLDWRRIADRSAKVHNARDIIQSSKSNASVITVQGAAGRPEKKPRCGRNTYIRFF